MWRKGTTDCVLLTDEPYGAFRELPMGSRGRKSAREGADAAAVVTWKHVMAHRNVRRGVNT